MHRMPIVALMVAVALAITVSSAAAESSNKEKSVIRVGVFNGDGGGTERATHYEAIMRMDPDIRVISLNAIHIRDDFLEVLDVLCFTGGNDVTMSRSLGDIGRDKVKEFVAKGGGYVGFCAGAYLAACNEDGSHHKLGMVNTEQVQSSGNWNGGQALVRLQLTEQGKSLFPECKKQEFVHMHYDQGILFIPSNKPGLGSYESLMTFVSDVRPNRSVDSMPGKTALVRAKYGMGTLVLCSPHPELTPGVEWMLPRMVRMAAQRRAISYPARFVNPLLYSKEIMCDKKWKTAEKTAERLLPKGSAGEKVQAMKQLKELGSKSWPLKRALPRLIFDESPKVRRTAAEMLIYYNQFLALNKVKAALKTEMDPAVKHTLQKTIEHLSTERIK
jgi:glutamine amidotransferase-like uncharacterized protein